MFTETPALMKERLSIEIDDREAAGFYVAAIRDRLSGTADSLDAITRLAEELAGAPLRPEWPYREPSDLDAILRESGAAALQPPRRISSADLRPRIEAAFLGRVCGCMLGKPLEVGASLEELERAGRSCGEWPIADYVSETFLRALGRRHHSWTATVRGRIEAVAPDDDLNYTLLVTGVLLERGRGFTRNQLATAWLRNLAPGWTYGPERTFLSRLASASLNDADEELDLPDSRYERWAEVQNPGAEMCGAAIRADAYGYACAGDPSTAARLAWRDAALTHRRTGIYAAMFIAAAVASAPTAPSPAAIFETAVSCIPRRSRFFEAVTRSLEIARSESSWLEAYRKIHREYGAYGHCRLYQECGTLINSVLHAGDTGQGIGLQVSQGNDTDSFAATAGSILGMFRGPAGLPERFSRVFNNRINTTLAQFHEQRLSEVCSWVGNLAELAQSSG
ncbi:ADP-ribosylglycohydrolase family protein [Salinispira pacifica]